MIYDFLTQGVRYLEIDSIKNLKNARIVSSYRIDI